MCDEEDDAFAPWNGRISNINLYYYGLGLEYPTKHAQNYPHDVERNHPDAFVEGNKEYELRLDFNLIWSVYEDDIDDTEMFHVMVSW